MEIKYRKVFPFSLMVCSLVCLGIYAVIGFNISVITAIIPGVFAFFMFTKPALVIHKNSVEVKNMYGMTMRTIAFNSGELEVNAKGIYIEGKRVLSPFSVEYKAAEIKAFLDGN
jgi:hypothetical protein